MIKIIKIQNFRKEFNSKFGFIFFIRISELFISTGLRTIEFITKQKQAKTFDQFLNLWFEFGIIFILNMILIELNSYFNSKQQFLYEQIANEMLMMNSKETSSVVQHIKFFTKSNGQLFSERNTSQNNDFNMIKMMMLCTKSNNEVKAFNLLIIDRKLILSFVIGLVPFCVLLIELKKISTS